MTMPQYIPIMLNCEGWRIVIVGGGRVAERKVSSLLEGKAEIVVISYKLTPWLKSRHTEGVISWFERGYIEGDLEGARLVFATTDQVAVNEAVIMEATALRIPVNHAGDGERGSFITPSMIRRGKLIIAVSTSGAGPRIARSLCHEIDKQYGDEYETYIDFISNVRAFIKELVPDGSQRQSLFKLLAEMDILTEIREGNFLPWSEEEITSWISEYREV
ncbi:bifunctional precorrin-2 dehydrogenase/sirohydrochlorin ferrochelatase [Paenibacillus anaericanus]|uniref:precorrin-2 dehydrogenase n=2 Tax=Paenibacillus anaericanus TaxID=170367 RepID=A0A3S1E998_9BACL|nr:bifunctional precorrin-2 dehydrogenase/sirohydrochlorin ferrochelatase [Paenibacillus anaericanus]